MDVSIALTEKKTTERGAINTPFNPLIEPVSFGAINPILPESGLERTPPATVWGFLLERGKL